MTTKRMKSRDIRDNWRETLRHVENGGTVIVEHYNKPIARIVPIEEPAVSATTDTARTAARIIARARDAHGGADAFDWQIKVEGIKPFGELYNEAYIIANEHLPQVDTATTDAELAERKARAAALWEQVLPELERYAADCKAAKFTGWSKESEGPIRRVR